MPSPKSAGAEIFVTERGDSVEDAYEAGKHVRALHAIDDDRASVLLPELRGDGDAGLH